MAMDGPLFWVAFLGVSSGVVLLYLVVGGRKSRLDNRLDNLVLGGAPPPDKDSVAHLARSTLPKMGAPLMPKSQEERTKLQSRLMHAGLYQRQAMVVFLGVKMLLMVGPAIVGLALGVVGLVSITTGLIGGALLGIFGMIGPSFWLDRMKAARQATFRRALPDALDVLVICLEGGLSLGGALRRVAGELRTAHPALAAELNIVQREIQLGMSTGEALRQFGERTDLEEIRSLAGVIIQAERFGASLVKALRVHAQTLREKRLQYAEEMAAQAATKLLIPTILFILPCVFVVILAPAAIQLLQLFDHLQVGGSK
jgi:tight adherence protein C